MKQDKIKLLSAAIMLSGLLSVSPAIADDEVTFPIEIKDATSINGGAYSDKTNGVYKVVENGNLELAPIDETQAETQSVEFKNNSNTNGGAITVENGGYLTVNGYTFSENKAEQNGGAIYINTEDSTVLTQINNSTFENNIADKGGAIYSNASVEVTDSSFRNNTANQGSAIYAADVIINAVDNDVVFENNSGYGIYSTTGDIELNAAAGKTITINDKIYGSSSTEMAGINITGAGKYVLNNKIDLSSTFATGFYFNADEEDGGANGAVLNLGKKAATGSYSVMSEVENATISLQNENGGDVLTISYLVSANEDGVINIKLDFDAKEDLLDKVVVDNSQHPLKQTATPNLKFDFTDININDDEEWGSDELKDTTRQYRYLTDNSGNVNDLTEDGTYESDDGVTYTFTVDKENKGYVTVARTEDGMSIEDAIASETRKGYTIRRGDLTLSDESNGLGTLNENKTEFFIDGQGKYALDGNGKDGLVIANNAGNDQTVDILDVTEFKNFKTAVNNNGYLHVENTTFADNEVDLINTGVADANNVTFNSEVQNKSGFLTLIDSTVNGKIENNSQLNVYGNTKINNDIIDSQEDVTGILNIGEVDSTEKTSLSFGKDNTIKQAQVYINENGSLEIYADKLDVSGNVVNRNQLTLKAQEDSDETISNTEVVGDGTTTIDGGVVKTTKAIRSKYIIVNNDSTLKVDQVALIGASDETELVTNNGTVELGSGTLGTKIEGGKIAMTGDVTTIADHLAGSISNNGELTLTGGTLSKDIAETENGSVVIDSADSVVNEAVINQNITVKSGNFYTTVDGIGKTLNVEDVDSYVQLNADGVLTEGKIDGVGTLYIGGNIEFAFDNSDKDSTNILGNLVLTTKSTFKPADTYTGANNKVLFADDSTIDLANGKSQNVNFASLGSTEDGNDLILKADYGDTFDAEDVSNFGDNSSVVVKSLDLSNMEETSETTYTFTKNLKDKVDMDLEEITFSDKVDKNSVYYMVDETAGDGKIYIDKLDGLEAAIQKIEDDEINLHYQMNSSEELTANKEITKGNMTILGKGNTINGKSLTVGDGTNERRLKLIDVNLNNTDVADDEYSLIVKDKATVDIGAIDNDITIAGKIHLEKDDNATSSGEDKLAFAVKSGRTITINNKITSDVYVDDTDPDNPVTKLNKVTFAGEGADSKIVANGVFDPFVADVNNVTLERYNYDSGIAYNLNDGGVLKYDNDLYLYDASKHGSTSTSTYALNSINFNNGTLDVMNGAANQIQLASLSLADNSTSSIMVDVDMANGTMDSLNSDNITVGNNAKLNITKMNIISDGESKNIQFTDNADLWNAVEYTGEQGLSNSTVLTPIYKYDVAKNESASDGFSFTRKGGYEGFNPAVYASSVAMQGIYYTQLNNYDVALANVDQTMLKTKAQRKAEKFANKYAYDGDETQVFSPLYTQLENKGVWFKPYVSTERVDLKSGPDVDNTMYGALVGGDSVVIPAGDWDMQYSAYVGYNGSHQAFEGNEVTQNGGVVGLTAAAYRGDFFTALTANVSFHGADIKTNSGDADLATLATGVASKTGYNWELADGKFIIQPSWLMSYTFVNPFDDYKINGVKIKNDSLNAIQLAPGLKFIGNTEKGWQPYIGAKMVWNLIDETKVKANEVNLPETTTKAYVEYGLGLQKSVGERFTGFGQAMFRNGGRNGAAFTLGARWAVGSLASDTSKKK